MSKQRIPRNPCIYYERRGDRVRLRLQAMTNHELREVLTGLWARMDRDDQEDHIHALQHYLDPDSRLSPLAQALRDADRGHPGTIDISKLIDQEHGA